MTALWEMTYFSGWIMHMNVKMNASQGIHIKKGSDHLAGGFLTDFWVPNEIDSLNFQHMLLF